MPELKTIGIIAALVLAGLFVVSALIIGIAKFANEAMETNSLDDLENKEDE